MNTKKIISILLAFILCFACIPQMVFAQSVTFTALAGVQNKDSEGYAKLIDGKKTKSDFSKWGVSNFSSAYIVIEASEKIVVNGYIFTTGNDNADHTGRNPKNWTLSACNDYDNTSKSGTWIEIDKVENDTTLQDTNYTDYSFDIKNNNTAYKYYKLEITAIQSGNFMQLSEMEFLYDVVHMVTFDKNYENTETETIEWKNSLPQAPEREGYKFVGWYTQNGEDDEWGEEFTADSAVSSDMTVYAKWEEVYIVTFNVNDGTAVSTPITIEHGSALPEPPMRNGYKFGGWYTQNGENDEWGEPYTSDMIITSNIMVYARWLTTSVTFDKNGGDKDAVPNILGAGEGVPTTSSVKNGYKFIGWYTQNGADGEWGNEFTEDTPVNDDIIVYAKYEKAKITFDSNGGEHKSDTIEFLYGEGTPEANPERVGFIFGGWYTKNGTNDGEWGEEYGDETYVINDVTLYAKWNVPGYDCIKNVSLTAISGTAGNKNESYDCLVDGKKSPGNNFSKWCISKFSGAHVILKASHYTVITKYTLTTGNDNAENPGRNPKNWILYGSNDYDEEKQTGTWTIIDEVENDTVLQDKDYMSYDFKTDNTKAYKYYKFDITEIHSGTNMQLAELEFKCSACEHAWGSPTASEKATCTENGYDEYTCSKCGLVYVLQTEEAKGHVLGSDGLCLTCNKKFGIKVGEKYYYSLQDAIDEATAEDTIELSTDTEISDTAVISGITTLDLKGNTLTMTGNGRIANVAEGATFTLKDTSEAGTGKITGGKAEVGGCIYNQGTFNMTGGTITGCSATSGSGGAVFSRSNSDYTAEVNITGGSISGNTSTGGGGGISIAATSQSSKKSTLNISNAKIENNITYHSSNSANGGGIYLSAYTEAVIGQNTIIEKNSARNGGGIAVNKSTLKMTGGKIKDNSASVGEGGGFYIENASNVEIEGTEISNNTANDAGGGFEIIQNSTVTLNNVNILSNVAGFGGGISVNNSKVIITGGKINNNESKTNSIRGSGVGGGINVIYASSSSYKNNAEVIIDGTEISENKSQKEGGAIYLTNANASVKIENASVKGNTSTANGGAIYAQSNATVEFSNTIVENNVSSKSGGAVYSNSSNLTIGGGTISKNKATEQGNAIALIESTAEIAGNALIGENGEANSNVNGGGIYAAESTITIGSANIRNNYAKNGGGMYVDSNTLMTLNGGLLSMTGNKAEVSGGGIWCNTDKLYINGAVGIYMNYAGENYEQSNNIYLVGGNTLNIQSTETIDDNGTTTPSLINVTVQDGYKNVVSANDTDFSSKLGSDLSNYGLRYDSTDKIVKIEEIYTVTFVFPSGDRAYKYFKNETINAYMVKAFCEEIARTKSDAVFGGWFDGDVAYDFSKSVTKSATLKPKWLDATKPGLSITPDKYYVSQGVGTLYLAAYSGETLLGVFSKDAESVTSGSITDFGVIPDNTDCLKLFMWNDNLVPACEASTLSIAE